MPKLGLYHDADPIVLTSASGALTRSAAGKLHVRQDNLAAVTAPGVQHDAAAGYEVGSLWIDVTQGNCYICQSAAEGAAVWLMLARRPGGSAGSIQYHDGSDGFAGAANFSYDGYALNVGGVRFNASMVDVISDGTVVVDFRHGNLHYVDFSGQADRCTFYLQAPASPCTVTLKVKCGGSGSATWTPSRGTIIWEGSTSPVLSTGAEYRLIDFRYDGTHWLGSVSSPFTVILPKAPTSIVARAVSEYEIVLFWNNDAVEESTIIIERRTTDSEFHEFVTLPPNSNVYVDNSCYSGVTYQYRFKCVNTLGDSPYSTVHSATANTIPFSTRLTALAATNITATADNPWNVTFSWTHGTLTGTSPWTIIQRAAGYGPFKNVWVYQDITAAGTHSWTDETAEPGTTYTYRCEVTTSAGRSWYSDPVTVTTPPIPDGYPDRPANVTLSDFTDTTMTFTWTDANAGSAAYDIQICPVEDTRNWVTLATTEPGATTYTVYGHSRVAFGPLDQVVLWLNAKTAAFVRVRATKNGNSSAYTTEVKGCTCSLIKETPVVYDIGPGQTYTSINDFSLQVGWDNLGAGDTVQIHANEVDGQFSPYYERLMLTASGCPSKPITIRGINHSGGQQATLDGTNATTPAEFYLGYMGYSDVYLLYIGTHTTDSFGYQPSNIIIENLRLQNAYAGPSSNQTNTYTANDGTTRTWSGAASGIYIQKCDHLILRNNTITGNGNGIFGASDSTRNRNRHLHHLLIANNLISNNGTEGGSTQHQIYMEADRVTYEYNKIAATRGGSSLKDRGSYTVVRYNWIEGGGHTLDLVEADNACRWTPVSDGYPTVHVYGNVFLVKDRGTLTTATPFNIGGDSGGLAYRRNLMYFWHNTIVQYTTRAARYRCVIFNCNIPGTVVDARNNIIGSWSNVPGSTATDLCLMPVTATTYFGKNFYSTGYFVAQGTVTGIAFGVTDNAVVADDPGFADLANGDFAIDHSSSICVGKGGRLAGSTVGHPVLMEYLEPASGRSRVEYGEGADLGGLEAVPDVTAPTLVGVSASSNGLFVTYTFSEVVLSSGTGISLYSDSVKALSATYSSGSGTNSLVFTASRTILSTETLSTTYTPGDLRDRGGNAAEPFSVSVTNNSSAVPDLTPPTMLSASVSLDGKTITCVFSEDIVSGDANPISGFLATVDGISNTLTYASGVETQSIVFTCGTTIKASATTVTISYTAGNAQDKNENPLADFSDAAVTNGSGATIAPTVESTSTASTAVIGTTLTINKPTGVVNGSLLVAHVTAYNSANISFTAPSGWTLIRNLVALNLSAMYYKVVTDAASEPASYTWTINSSRQLSGAVMRIAGHNGTNPINASAAYYQPSSYTWTWPAVTTTSGDCLMLRVFGNERDETPTAGTKPTGLTIVYDVYSTGGTSNAESRSCGYSSNQSLAGVSDTPTITIGVTRSSALITIAIAP